MPLERRIGMGVTLGVDIAGGSVFVALGAVVDAIDGPDAVAEDGDITILANTFKEFRKADIDPGIVTFAIAYDPKLDTTSQILGSLLLSTSLILPNWQISYPDAGAGAETETFKGYVKSLGRNIRKREMIVQPVTIRVSGDPGFARTP